MNTSGVIVTTDINKIGRVSQQLAHMAGVEVHAIGENGKMVITIDNCEENRATESMLKVRNTDGVISASYISDEIWGESDQQKAV